METKEALKLAKLIVWCATMLVKNTTYKCIQIHSILGQIPTDEVPTILEVNNDGGYMNFILGDIRGNVSLDTGNLDNSLVKQGYISFKITFDDENGKPLPMPIRTLAIKIATAYNDMMKRNIPSGTNLSYSFIDFGSGTPCKKNRELVYDYLCKEIKRYVDMVNSDVRTVNDIWEYYLG